MWDKIRPKRTPCKCLQRVPQEHQWSHLARTHQVFSKSNKGPCTAAQPPVPPLPSCPCSRPAVAQLHSLGSACWENSPVGKHHVGSLAGSASTQLESCSPSQLFLQRRPEPLLLILTLILTHSLHILTGHCSARHGQSGSWPQLLAPDCSALWAAALPSAPN